MFRSSTIVGFPVVEATVDYPAEGYAAVMGWVQVVALRGDRRAESGEPETVVLGGELTPLTASICLTRRRIVPVCVL